MHDEDQDASDSVENSLTPPNVDYSYESCLTLFDTLAERNISIGTAY